MIGRKQRKIVCNVKTLAWKSAIIAMHKTEFNLLTKLINNKDKYNL